MLCENAFYPNKTGENRERPHCKCKEVAENSITKGKCPLIYWCPISEKFENTADMFDCVYREKNK